MAFTPCQNPINDPVLTYRKGSKEREEVLNVYKELYNKAVVIPLYIGSKKIVTDKQSRMSPPHEHRHTLGIIAKQHLHT